MYEQIFRDPRNNVYGATDTHWLGGNDLFRDIVQMWDEGQIKFLIILKTNNSTPDMAVQGGELVSDIEFNRPNQKGVSIVAGCIHRRHTGNHQGYGRKAFHDSFDHAFKRFYRNRVFLETQAANLPFRAMMDRIGPAPLEVPRSHWADRNPPEASVTYTFDQGIWEAA